MNNQYSKNSNWLPGKNWILFILLILFTLWAAHAIAFFPHEYAHSFTAWALGWKNNPLDLNYGHLSLSNFLVQFDIDENVNYDPIFAAGHNIEAGSIALAGLFIGNFLITYPLSRWGYKYARQHDLHILGFFFYWLCAASVGNLIDYVPVRTFAFTGDMHTLAKGFNCSPWVILIVLGIPFTIILGHFLVSLAPGALKWLFINSPGMRAVMVLFTALALFGFYGAAGWSATDPISHYISVVSVYALVPVAIIAGIWYINKSQIKSQG